MIDLWQEIYGTIKRNKLRTFLTGFAVAWGIFMLIVLLGAGNGIIHAFEQNASERALNSIRIFPGWTTKSYDGLKEGRASAKRPAEVLRDVPAVREGFASACHARLQCRSVPSFGEWEDTQKHANPKAGGG